MSDGGGANVIFDLQFQSDLTLKGDNSTIVMDMSKGLHTYVNINEGKNMAVQGLNFKTEKSVYAIADVERIDIANCTLDFKTDRSLGIHDSFSFAIGDCFGLPYTGKDINRMHMFFQQIEVLDASANRYRIQFINRDDLQNQDEVYAAHRLPVPGAGARTGDRRSAGRLLLPIPPTCCCRTSICGAHRIFTFICGTITAISRSAGST